MVLCLFFFLSFDNVHKQAHLTTNHKAEMASYFHYCFPRKQQHEKTDSTLSMRDSLLSVKKKKKFVSALENKVF